MTDQQKSDNIDSKLSALIEAIQLTNQNIRQSGEQTRTSIDRLGERMERSAQETRTSIDRLGERMEQSAERTLAAIRQSGEETRAAIRQSGEETRAAIRQSGEETRAAIADGNEKLDRLLTASIEQRKTVQMLVGTFSEQSKAISSLSKTTTRLVDAAQRSAQASEAASIVAQSNQNAIRDLIEELRENRSN